MLKQAQDVSMGTAALIAGFPLMFFFAPYGEFYVFAKLINHHNGAKTTQNLINNQQLFLSGVFSMLIVFIYDIVLAWCLYIFIRPVNPLLSLLGAWLRMIYAALAIVSLFNYLNALYVANLPGIDEVVRQQQVLQFVNARRYSMFLAYFLFSTYLVYIGMLMWKAWYIPKVLSVMSILAGIAYAVNFSLQPLFFKSYNFSWMMIFSLGELALAVWFLVKGRKIKDNDVSSVNFQ